MRGEQLLFGFVSLFKLAFHHFLMYTLKVYCTSGEFQIMEAKTVLHNIDQVFPEITHHLQTMTAVRYILHCEQENIRVPKS